MGSGSSVLASGPQETFAIIKPDAVAAGKAEEILAIIAENGKGQQPGRSRTDLCSSNLLVAADSLVSFPRFHLGFEIAQQQTVTLTKEKAESFYKEHEGKPFFETLTQFMSSGPAVILVLRRDDAIAKWRQLLGPTNTEKARQEAPDRFRNAVKALPSWS